MDIISLWVGRVVIIFCCLLTIAVGITAVFYWIGYAIGRGIAESKKETE